MRKGLPAISHDYVQRIRAEIARRQSLRGLYKAHASEPGVFEWDNEGAIQRAYRRLEAALSVSGAIVGDD